MSIYRVTGSWPYRGHQPDEVFEAYIEPDSEARALRLGVIELLERSIPQVRPGTFAIPCGWNPTPQKQEA